MSHKKNYKEIRREVKKLHAEMAEQPPDPHASERFKNRPYQAGNLTAAQADPHSLRWADLVDYMLRHVVDGSIRLSDPVVLPGQFDAVEYVADKYGIKREVADGQKDIKTIQGLAERARNK